MAIPPQYANQRLYHFTHIQNLPNILKYGLLSTNARKKLGIEYGDIAYSGIQDRRSIMEVPCGCGGVVHDYVPLYFCKKSPMLNAVVQNKIADEQQIIYLEFPIQIFDQCPSVFTDASANTIPPPNFYTDTCKLVHLDWEAINTTNWGRQYDKGPTPIRQKKQAEALIHKVLTIDSLNRIVVWNNYYKKEVKKIFEQIGITIPTIIVGGYQYYFIKGELPPVTGPFHIKIEYEKTIESTVNNLGETLSPKFANLFELKKALHMGLDCLQETSELIGLESDNIMHSEDIATHTCKVVSNLLETSEYLAMNDTDKLLVEIASFLHDIGKGPKSRWVSKGGRQQVDPDHPIKALPMLQRILTKDVGTMKKRSAKVICKLICYHDLIGDIIGKGRRIKELEMIVKNERELHMLIAISKADMKEVNPEWIDEEKICNIRDSIIEKLTESSKDNDES